MRLLAPLLLALALLPSCVTAPSPQEVLDTGYRTPRQTFHTLQVGVRGDLPGLEYACFSSAFRARFGLSQLAYREFREEVLEHEVAFWLGIPAAEVVREEAIDPRRTRLHCSSHGEEFVLELVREDYWQAWGGAELLADEALEEGLFEERAEVFDDGTGRVVLTGFALAPADLASGGAEALSSRLTEFRIGREWKIDGLGGLEGTGAGRP